MPDKNEINPIKPDMIFDDQIVPFKVDALNIRGRTLQLGSVVNDILQKHAYPDKVAELLAQMLALTALLGASLKFQGKLIAQIHSDGPVNLLICDFQTPQALRGYAKFDAEKIQGDISKNALIGKGILAITIDQGAKMRPYQAIVPLDGKTIEENIENYFSQSEQLPTKIRLSAAQYFSNENNLKTWRAGGIFVQSLPEASAPSSDKENEQETRSAKDKWNEVEALIKTIEPSELIDPTIKANNLLFRLFNAYDTHIFEPTSIKAQCNCSYERLKGILENLSPEEKKEAAIDGKIEVSCEFCAQKYQFPLQLLHKEH